MGERSELPNGVWGGVPAEIILTHFGEVENERGEPPTSSYAKQFHCRPIIKQLDLCCFFDNAPHVATSEMSCWPGGMEILRKLSLCDGAQRYEQFLQVGDYIGL